MNILIIVKLSDESLNNLLIKPLLNIPFVNHIYILRDSSSCFNHNRVTFLSEKKLGITNKLRHVIKAIYGITHCKRLRIDLVIGVLIYPHGFIGNAISLFTIKPYIHVTIAGHREFWVHGKFVEFLVINLFKRSRFITVTGTKTREYLINTGYAIDKLKIFPNVIDMNYFFPQDINKEYDILSLSRLDKNKNVSLLLRAVAKVKKKKDLKVAIAGSGPELTHLIEEANTLGISDIVTFFGWIEESKKIEMYNKSKLFVVCSEGEGFPLALLEAMACGCVPVAADVGDISDVVRNYKNGFLFQNVSCENELTNLLIEILDNENIVNSCKNECIKVRESHKYENNTQLWVDLLSTINTQN